MKIVTNSRARERKEWKDNVLFSIYAAFANESSLEEMKQKFEDGIGWGDAKNIVFEELNELIVPIRENFEKKGAKLHRRCASRKC